MFLFCTRGGYIMQVFDAIYKKENMLQCKFSDNFIHPDYLGTEFPLGHHLINAVVMDILKVENYYNDLIKTYISYLDEESESNFKKYENALFKIDDYCIYLHETTHVLLTAIKKIHPNYSLGDFIDFIDDFNPQEKLELTEQLRNIRKDGQIQLKECLKLWNIAVGFLLDKFNSFTDTISRDIYDICNSPTEVKGLDRLSGLDTKRKIQLLRMKVPTCLSVDLGSSVNSKFFYSQPTSEERIVMSISQCSTEQLMYYDLVTSLEKDLPIKLCKNCNKPFIPKGRPDSLYCDRIMPEFKYKCITIGAANTYKSKQPDIEVEFYAARKRYSTRSLRNPILKPEFDVWKIKGKEKLIAYRNGEISADEFKTWFMNDEWTKS